MNAAVGTTSTGLSEAEETGIPGMCTTNEGHRSVEKGLKSGPFHTKQKPRVELTGRVPSPETGRSVSLSEDQTRKESRRTQKEVTYGVLTMTL